MNSRVADEWRAGRDVGWVLWGFEARVTVTVPCRGALKVTPSQATASSTAGAKQRPVRDTAIACEEGEEHGKISET